ncbi:UDP-N-acetylmuramoyl-L-alanyl-D-glutamate--2,6-diaminopimelate ligase [Nitrosophilus alvini]|uniref:UDP-N-acetylmuramoyl-L-alanyl-D-glutamate--2, 6-diaminopimelate ligase n=1 Tax=Nitrosophilus alvini TaxID=2714855 RepID=UPI00190D6C24|nr:UDP-N-acetylmuramoyl-L-alanyl-D-glutamate--2,6-diaminopimelate ligase [Nitrosophilus alvini]
MRIKLDRLDRYITDNSKEIEKGDLFLKTWQNAAFSEEAKKAGADIVTPAQIYENLEIDRLKIIGITGTNGKTTTAAAIYSILLDLGYKTALQGTRGFFINDAKAEEKSLTTPPILQNLYNMNRALEEGCEFFVMEVSSHAIAQKRVESIDFTLKILTNITQDHLDFHKSLENYIYTKNSFFADESLKLINKDEEKAKFNIKNAMTYGVENPATFQVMAYTMKEGLGAVIRFGSEIADFHSQITGLFNLYNLTAAIAAAKIVTNKELKEICETVENFGGVSGRMEVVCGEPLVIVDFAHTPDGMQKVFEAFPGKDIAVVFGAGGDRDRGKRPKMGAVANRYAKKIYLTSDNPRNEKPEKIIEEIYVGINDKEKVKILPDRKEAIKRAVKELKKEEILLILGKGDEEYQIVGDRKIPFDDRRVIREIFMHQDKNGF